MKIRLPQSLHVRLWLVVAVACVPIFVLVLLDYRQQHQGAIHALQREVQAMLQSAHQAEEGTRRSMLQTFNIMARADNLQSLDGADCSGLSQRLLQSMPEFADLGAVLPDGRIFCSALMPAGARPSVADRAWFLNALERDGVGAGEFVTSRISGLRTMMYGFPVRSSDGSVLAVLYASLPLQWFNALSAQLQLPEGWSMFLLDSAGEVLTYHPGDEQPAQHRAHVGAAFWQALRTGPQVLELQGLDGLRRMYGVDTPRHALTPLLVAIGAPLERTVERLEQGFWWRMALLAALALASALVARYYIYNLIEGWTQRTRSMLDQVAQGRLTTRIHDLSGAAELAQLESGINHMVSELERREGELRRLSTAVEQSPVALVMTDTQSRIIYVNPAFEQQTGYTSAEVLGQHPSLLGRGQTPEAVYEAMWSQLRLGEIWRGEFTNQHKNGTNYIVRVTITPIKDTHGAISHVVGTLEDITAQRLAQQQIERLAYYDSLTGLANRSLLQQRMAQALQPGADPEHQALLLFDIARFSQVNDTWGHAAGDALLQQMAQRIVHSAPQGGTLARLGSNTFGILTPVQHPAHPLMLAQNLLQVLSEVYTLEDGQRLYPSVSAGLALAQAQTHRPEQLLKHAEIALYRAQRSASALALQFDASMQAAADEHAALEMGMREAIAHEGFALHYQVQVNGQGHPTGAEALLRWPCGPKGKPVSPAQFIPLAEECGLIMPLGQWVLERACDQLALWQAQASTRTLTLSINVSARQFHQSDFVAQVRAALTRSGIDPRGLKLELTESAALAGVENTAKRMQELHALGLRFALDDFGTGYSSLSYLQRLPFDQLKIDQSFTRAMLHDATSSAIVRAILVMSEALGLDVVAEGVETIEHHAFLQQHGCQNFQGYWFGKPLPIKAWEAAHGSGAVHDAPAP